MRAFVNNGGAWFDEGLSGDAFTALGRFMAAFCVATVVVGGLIVGVVWGISAVSPPLNHGSCKYQHWVGKFYACDEYYPLPQTVGQR